MNEEIRVSKPSFEITDNFYEEYLSTAALLAEVEESLVLYTDGLDALEKSLMKEHDAKFISETKKSAPEYLQRREAKADPRFQQAVSAKASLVARRVMLKAKMNVFDMRYQEWRTRSANRRTGLN